MAKQKTTAVKSAAGQYAARIAKINAFVSKPFPAKKATAAQKKRARDLYRVLFGFKEKIKPTVTSRTTAVHLVSSKREKEKAIAAAKIFDRTIDPETTDVEHVFQIVPKKDIPRIKADIGQDTPQSVNTIFITKDKIPGKKTRYSHGDVVKLLDRYVTLNSEQVIIFRPVDTVAWISDPKEEEARVMDQLTDDVDDIRTHFKKVHGSEPLETVRFTPKVGNHQYFGSGQEQPEIIHKVLHKWRNEYGIAQAVKPGQAPVSEFFSGINCILFLSQNAKRQYNEALETQRLRRIEKGNMRRRMEQKRTELSYRLVMLGGRGAARDTIADLHRKIDKLTKQQRRKTRTPRKPR